MTCRTVSECHHYQIGCIERLLFSKPNLSRMFVEFREAVFDNYLQT
jgi:hypothetical protein